MSSSSRRSGHGSSHSSSRSSATANFRDDYRTPALSNDQKRQIQRDQRDYDRMPSGGHRDVARYSDRLDSTQAKWEDKSAAREREYERTEPARMARSDRTHPDIRSLRTAKNQEEHALAKREHAGRNYDRASAGGSNVDIMNGSQRRMVSAVSNNRLPAELVNQIGDYADFPRQAPPMPSRREYARPRYD